MRVPYALWRHAAELLVAAEFGLQQLCPRCSTATCWRAAAQHVQKDMKRSQLAAGIDTNWHSRAVRRVSGKGSGHLAQLPHTLHAAAVVLLISTWTCTSHAVSDLHMCLASLLQVSHRTKALTKVVKVALNVVVGQAHLCQVLVV